MQNKDDNAKFDWGVASVAVIAAIWIGYIIFFVSIQGNELGGGGFFVGMGLFFSLIITIPITIAVFIYGIINLIRTKSRKEKQKLSTISGSLLSGVFILFVLLLVIMLLTHCPASH